MLEDSFPFLELPPLIQNRFIKVLSYLTLTKLSLTNVYFKNACSKRLSNYIQVSDLTIVYVDSKEITITDADEYSKSCTIDPWDSAKIAGFIEACPLFPAKILAVKSHDILPKPEYLRITTLLLKATLPSARFITTIAFDSVMLSHGLLQQFLLASPYLTSFSAVNVELDTPMDISDELLPNISGLESLILKDSPDFDASESIATTLLEYSHQVSQLKLVSIDPFYPYKQNWEYEAISDAVTEIAYVKTFDLDRYAPSPNIHHVPRLTVARYSRETDFIDEYVIIEYLVIFLTILGYQLQNPLDYLLPLMPILNGYVYKNWSKPLINFKPYYINEKFQEAIEKEVSNKTYKIIELSGSFSTTLVFGLIMSLYQTQETCLYLLFFFATTLIYPTIVEYSLLSYKQRWLKSRNKA